ncbi:hypothetical protein [Carboxylicivirga marina]|uniref:Uncharacterized protein n=1 Tax=Carboxylicivirga marina TaxID=2800988 RepID=A0ABS1HNZ6_9BACT|nr:hypothetical protein [Carboxylicivirga marina]MBK3519389.1 hypothetical protein [Carboxylicivirga marina]
MRLTILLILCITTTFSFSQDKVWYEPIIKKYFEVWKTVCDLTDKQEEEVLNLLTEMQLKIVDFRKKNTENEAAIEKYAQERRKIYTKKLRNLVGETNYQKMVEHWKSQLKFDADMDVDILQIHKVE